MLNLGRALAIKIDNDQRQILEDLADCITTVARTKMAGATVTDQGNNDQEIKHILLGLSFDISQLARLGTVSFGV